MRVAIQSLILFCAQLGFFIPIAQTRLIARDEGFYLLASRLVIEGRVLYRDFFFPQMPLSPYIYGWWMALFGMSWESGRVLSAVLTALVGVMLFLYCQRRLSAPWGWVAVGLFATCNFVFPWYLNIRTYSLSVFFLFAAFLLLDRTFGERNSLRTLSAGLLFGLAIDTRLFFIGILPFVALAIWVLSNERREGFKQAVVLCIGAGIALLPNLILFIPDPVQYYFNNYGYHAIRSDYSDAQALNNKWRVVKVLFGLVQGQSFVAPQLPILLWLSVLSVIWSFVKGRRLELAFCFALPLFVLNLLPKPTYLQYASTLVPFLVILVAVFCDALVKQVRQSTNRAYRSTILIALLGLGSAYLSYVPADVTRYTKSGEGVIGIRDEENAELWNIPSIQAISRRVSELTEPGDFVLAFWPGHIFESHAQPLPGMENHFGFGIAPKLSPAERIHHRVVSGAELNVMIRDQLPKLALIKVKSKPRMRKQLLAAGYNKLKDFEGMEWYRRG